jgi:hypothetical protein
VMMVADKIDRHLFVWRILKKRLEPSYRGGKRWQENSQQNKR